MAFLRPRSLRVSESAQDTRIRVEASAGAIPDPEARSSSQAGVRRLNSATFASTAQSRSAPLVRGRIAAPPVS